jgi:predicted DsbA family dithiol-disulfide isomerase
MGGASAAALAAVVHVSVVLDFMCPWSFIGMKSLSLAMQRSREHANVRLQPASLCPQRPPTAG